LTESHCRFFGATGGKGNNKLASLNPVDRRTMTNTRLIKMGVRNMTLCLGGIAYETLVMKLHTSI